MAFPCAMVLMVNSREDNYNLVLDEIIKMVQEDVGGPGVFSPDIIHIDGEMSAYNSFKAKFPLADILSCYFHIIKNFRSHLCQIGFKNRLDHNHDDFCHHYIILPLSACVLGLVWYLSRKIRINSHL